MASKKKPKKDQPLLPVHLTGLDEGVLMVKNQLRGLIELPAPGRDRRLRKAAAVAGLPAPRDPAKLLASTSADLQGRVSEGELSPSLAELAAQVRDACAKDYANVSGYHAHGMAFIHTADPGQRASTRQPERRGFLRYDVVPGADLLDVVHAAGLTFEDLRDYTMCTLAAELCASNPDLAILESSNPDAIVAVHISHDGGSTKAALRAAEWMMRQVVFVALRALDRSLRRLLKLPNPRRTVRKALQDQMASVKLSPELAKALRARASGARTPGTVDAPTRAAVAAGRTSRLPPQGERARQGYAASWGTIELREGEKVREWLVEPTELLQAFAGHGMPASSLLALVKRWWDLHAAADAPTHLVLSLEPCAAEPGALMWIFRVSGGHLHLEAAARWLGTTFLKRLMPDLTAYALRAAEDANALATGRYPHAA